MTIQGIDRETAEGLVKGGFHSLEGLLAADLNDLTDILGAEKAAAAQQAANAEQERREAAQPPQGGSKSRMSIRVHELAKRCGLSNKDMIEKLHTMNYPVKSHSSTVDKITAESIEKEYGYVAPPPTLPPAPEAPVTPAPTPAAVAAEKTDGAATVATLPPPAPVVEAPKPTHELPPPAPAKITTAAPASPAPVAPPIQVQAPHLRDHRWSPPNRYRRHPFRRNQFPRHNRRSKSQPRTGR